jgi:hypothetical protein
MHMAVSRMSQSGSNYNLTRCRNPENYIWSIPDMKAFGKDANSPFIDIRRITSYKNPIILLNRLYVWIWKYK